jgi:protease-4
MREITMSLDADHIVDRRRMRRKLTVWRVAAVFAAIIAVGIAAARFSGSARTLLADGPTAYVARISIQGLIRNDRERVEALDRLSKSNVRAVIVHIDSPGGTTSGAEQLYDALRELAAKKPTVAVVDGLAASGGYIAALGADYIVAQQSSLVGSIGVLFQYPNFSDLLKTVGVKVEEVKSSPLKAAPNGFEPTSPEARAALEAIVKDSYTWFRGLVQARRQLDEPATERVADGRVFTGRQAIDLKLIDQIGNETQAMAWLAKEKGVDAKLPIRDYKLRSRFSDFSFLHLAASTAFEAVGLGRLEDSAAIQAAERLNLDGLLALWHPSVAN